jgi:hypothetical protein
MKRKSRIGRPPRKDRPVRINTRLAGVVREWLARQAEREGRSEGAIIEDALALYRGRKRGAR